MSFVRSTLVWILPKSRLEWALYLFVLLCAIRPWALGWVLYPHDPEAARVIYRAPFGDTEYFPIINSLARGNLGEGAVYEAHGTGVISFPIASMIIHVAGTALAGPLWGYIGADIVVTFLFFFVFRFWCRLFSGHELWTSFLAALFISGLLQIVDGFGHQLFHVGEIWGERIPRPFVSEIYLTAGVGLMTWMAWDPSVRNKISSWLLFGAVMALSLQSFIYFLPALGGAAAFLALQWLWEDRRDWPLILSRIAYSLGAFLVLALPFVCQRLLETPGAAARMGLVSVDRWFVLFHTPWTKDPCVVVGLIIVAVFGLTNASASSRLGLPVIPGRVLGLLAAMQMAAFLGLPLMAVATGHLIQEYHFALITATIQTLLLVALVARFGPSVPFGVLRHPAFAAALLVFGYMLGPYHVVHRHLLDGALRTDMYSSPGPAYHRAFTALTKELDRDLYRNSIVLTTLDDQVFAYWVGFRGRFSFFPKAWNTTLSENEIKDRMLWFAREEGLDFASLVQFLDQRTITYYWLSGDSYSIHSPGKMEEFRSRYAQILAMDEKEKPRLDIIVLSADRKLVPLPEPDPSRYSLTYHDDYFKVWKAIKPPAQDGK